MARGPDPMVRMGPHRLLPKASRPGSWGSGKPRDTGSGRWWGAIGGGLLGDHTTKMMVVFYDYRLRLITPI